MRNSTTDKKKEAHHLNDTPPCLEFRFLKENRINQHSRVKKVMHVDAYVNPLSASVMHHSHAMYCETAGGHESLCKGRKTLRDIYSNDPTKQHCCPDRPRLSFQVRSCDLPKTLDSKVFPVASLKNNPTRKSRSSSHKSKSLRIMRILPLGYTRVMVMNSMHPPMKNYSKLGKKAGPWLHSFIAPTKRDADSWRRHNTENTRIYLFINAQKDFLRTELLGEVLSSLKPYVFWSVSTPPFKFESYGPYTQSGSVICSWEFPLLASFSPMVVMFIFEIHRILLNSVKSVVHL